MMGKRSGGESSGSLACLGSFLRSCLFRVLSVGPIPAHIAFIMDGNRRFAKKGSLEVTAGHKAGFSALISMLKYCYELGVRYVTVYAFSIDNFKRQPDEVHSLMDLMLEKIQGLLDEASVVNQYGIRVYFIGNLKLLSVPVREAAEEVMRATAKNTKCSLLVCIAYTSCDEIVHAVEESCKAKLRAEMIHSKSIEPANGWVGDATCSTREEERLAHANHDSCKDKAIEYPERRLDAACNGVTQVVGKCNYKNGADTLVPSIDACDEDEELHFNKTSSDMLSFEKSKWIRQKNSAIKMVDIEKHMYMAVAPDPDILIRSSGETRLSNFLLWQTSNCPLYSPNALWPEIGLWHLVWAVLTYQRNYSYLEKKKKKL